MGASTDIEWTDATWNPLRGCSRISPGCKFCYAELIAARFSGPGQAFEGLAEMTPSGPRWTRVVRVIEEHMTDPLRWRKPRSVFVNSVSDLFHESLGNRDIDRVFAVMFANHVLAGAKHVFQILTKRAERLREYFNPKTYAGVTQAAHLLQGWADAGDGLVKMKDRDVTFSEYAWGQGVRTVPVGGGQWTQTPWADMAWPLPNVWLGVSVEDVERLSRIEELRQTPAAVRFLSLEPLLEDLGELDLRGIDWVIVGGESGSGAREFDIEWARAIVRQCRAAGARPFVKQLGSQPTERGRLMRLRDRHSGGDMAEWPPDLRVREFPVIHNPSTI